MKVRTLILFGILLIWSIYTKAQFEKSSWFPEQTIFPILEYDLLETQVYTGIFVLNAETVNYEGAYIPVNLGVRKSILEWKLFSMKCDMGIGAASYTQFEMIRFDRETLRGGLLNTDFKAAGFLSIEAGSNRFRIQLFHISSHLGDDYMLRNQYFELNNKSVNYEQIDVTYLLHTRNIEYYMCIGEVITPNAYRERFMAEIGVQGVYSLNQTLHLAFGSDIKFYKEYSFSPEIHSGFGITIVKRERPQVNFSIDSYFGNLPFSTLSFGNVIWLGLSSRIYL